MSRKEPLFPHFISQQSTDKVNKEFEEYDEIVNAGNNYYKFRGYANKYSREYRRYG